MLQHKIHAQYAMHNHNQQADTLKIHISEIIINTQEEINMQAKETMTESTYLR
jgi:hypothetical protein